MLFPRPRATTVITSASPTPPLTQPDVQHLFLATKIEHLSPSTTIKSQSPFRSSQPRSLGKLHHRTVLGIPLHAMVIQKKMSEGKKTRGRQRIEIKELVDESKKQVTFSKRRAGLFKKAGELCVLCGAEVAIIVFSPHNNVFCFGHPDVETVLDRYLTGNHASFSHSSSLHDQNLSNVNVPAAEFMNIQYAEAQEELETENKRLAEIEEEVKRRKMENNGEYLWWEEPLDENMGLEEMEHYMSALQEMRWKVGSRLEEIRMMRSATASISTDACAWDWGTMLV